MNVFNIKRAFETRRARGWDKTFWCIDVHHTIFPGKYDTNQEFEIYPGCLEVLKWISAREDQVLILWTSSYKAHIDEIKKYFKTNHNICVDFVNENPLCTDTHCGSFHEKFYFNILLDDRAGFEGETDWYLIKNELQSIGEWKHGICSDGRIYNNGILVDHKRK